VVGLGFKSPVFSISVENIHLSCRILQLLPEQLYSSSKIILPEVVLNILTRKPPMLVFTMSETQLFVLHLLDRTTVRKSQS
jgi:hypothetical protein